MMSLFQLMEVGVNTETGQIVRLSAVEVPRPDPGNVTTLPPLMAEQIVWEMIHKLSPAMMILVQVNRLQNYRSRHDIFPE